MAYHTTSGRTVVLDAKTWKIIKADCKASFDTSPKDFEMIWGIYKSLLKQGHPKPKNISEVWSTLSDIYDQITTV